jgi:AcrR family transcriptional regulator
MGPYTFPTSPSQGSQVRDRLLKAAKVLFLLRGLDAVTTDDICLAADVSKGGFYHHFPGKESPFLEIALEELEREMDLLASPTPDIGGGRGASALLLDLWAWSPRHPQARHRVQAIHRRTLRRLSRLTEQATRQTQSPGDRKAQAALALLMSIGQVVQHATAQHLIASERKHRKAAAS